MSQARGFKGRLLLDFESSFKTDPDPVAAMVMPFNSLSLTATRSLQQAQTITGRRDPVAPFEGNLDVSGDITVPVDVTAMGYWLRAMFGAPSTSGAGPYVHEFKVGDTMPSLVLEKQFSGISQFAKYSGCKISSFGLDVGGDGELVATLGVLGASEDLSGVAYDADPTTISLTRFSNYQASLEEDGVALSNGTMVSLNIDFGLDGENYVIGGAGERGDIPEGLISVSGTLTTLFEDATLLNKAINGTESSLVITLTNGTNVLTLDLNELRYERRVPDIQGPEGILAELNFQAYFDNHADDSVVVATLTNGTASYA